jgi:hypothetical protein
VTFETAQPYLDVETQRPWSDKAIDRTTPLLLGVFSWIKLVTHTLHWSGSPIAARQTAWYARPPPTISDALAFVYQHLWACLIMQT